MTVKSKNRFPKEFFDKIKSGKWEVGTENWELHFWSVFYIYRSVKFGSQIRKKVDTKNNLENQTVHCPLSIFFLVKD